MKFLKFPLLLILFVSQFSFLSKAQTVNALAGTYTIGTPTADFPDFATAFTTLSDEGVSDAVTFEVLAGTYSEDITLRFFPNSGNHPVTVTSEENVIIEGLFTINTASNVTLRGLQLRAEQKAIEIKGSCDFITFDELDILINNGEQVIFSYHIAIVNTLTNFRLQNSVLRGGQNGIFNDQIGGKLQDAIIENNQIDVAETAIRLDKCENITIRNNQINKDLLWIPGIGNSNICLFFSECSGLIQVEQNRLFGRQKRLIEISEMTVADQLSIVNNYGYLYTTGTHTRTGAVVLYDIPKLDFIYNTIINQVGGQQLTIRAADPQHNISNNILQSDRSASLLSLDYTGISNVVIDNNLYYNVSHEFSSFYNGQLFSSLSDWQMQTGLDVNSMNAPVTFAFMDSYQTNDADVQNAGQPQTTITVDIEGNQRKPTVVSIGAFETNYVRQNDASITQVNVPTTPFAAGEHPLSVQLTNFGDAPLQSVDIHYHVNGILQTFAWTGNLATSANEIVDLGTISYTPLTSNQVVVATQLPNGVEDEFIYNDELTKMDLYPALAGDYSVGTVDSDFADLSTAIDYMDRAGVVDATNLNLADGIYQKTDRIIFKPVLGASAINRITVQSAAQDATTVTWQRGQFSDYTFWLQSVQFIDFKHLTFNVPNRSTRTPHALFFTGGGGESEISYCNFIGQESAEFIVGLHEKNDTPDLVYKNINIHHNVFTGGEKSIYFNDELADEVDFNISNISIHDNEFKEQNVGVSLICVHQASVFNNTFTDYRYGMFLNACSDFLVRNNQLNGGGSNFEGISIRDSHNIDDDNKIINNYIEISGTLHSKNGLLVQRLRNTQILHNTIRSVADVSPENVNLLSVSGQLENIIIQNNLLTANGGRFISYGIDDNTTALNWNNNIFDGSSSNFAQINENRKRTSYPTLEDWQNSSNHDTQSRVIDPDYLQPNGYIIQNQATRVITDTDATVMAGNDIENQIRPTSYPAMAGVYEAMPRGADLAVVGFSNLSSYQLPASQSISIEVVNLGNTMINDISVSWSVNGGSQTDSEHTINLAPFASTTVEIGQFTFVAGEIYQFAATATPTDVTDEYLTNNEYKIPEVIVRLFGTYTVGGTEPDIIDVVAAFEKLQKHGIAGEVTFTIRDGDYTARPILQNYYSHLIDHQVTFQAADESEVNITLEKDRTDHKGMELEQIKNIRFIGLHFIALNQHYHSVIHLEDSDQIIFNKCDFSYTTVHHQDFDPSVIIRVINQDDSYQVSSFTATACNFNTPNNAFLFDAKVLATPTSKIKIQDNYFQDIVCAFRGVNFDNLIFTNNTVEWINNTEAYNLINVTDVGNLQILNNRFYARNNSFVRVYIGSVKENFARALIANNLMVATATGGSAVFQLEFSETTHLDVLHNTIFSTGRDDIILIQNSSGLNILNNIFSNISTHRLMYIANDTDINWDYNVYYHPNATQFAFANEQVISNFADWQQIKSIDEHSQMINPEFNSVYYPMALAVQNSAQYSPRVITDLDGKLRDTSTPDPGAFENFSNEQPLAIQPIHLQAQVVENQKVNLIWQGGETTKTTPYQIEHSTDGQTFLTIGQQSAERNDKYQFTDLNPSLEQNYYRLRYNNVAGETEYSNIVRVTIESPIVKVFPNPMTDFLTIEIIEPTNDLNIMITDAVGKEVYHSSNGGFNQKIDVTDWVTGSYSIHIKTDNKKWIKHIIKQ